MIAAQEWRRGGRSVGVNMNFVAGRLSGNRERPWHRGGCLVVTVRVCACSVGVGCEGESGRETAERDADGDERDRER